MKLLLLALLLPWPAFADAVVATRLIRSTEVVQSGDVVVQRGTVVAGAATSTDQVVGLEARVAIYPGRPVRVADLGPAAVIERNETVVLIYRQGGLTILSEGRALGRAGLGDAITVMNASSRQSVQGRVINFGQVEVGADLLP